MDPVTHIVVGAGIAEIAGEEFSLSNPVYMAAVLGSLVPDLDIIYQIRGHILYLKNHRGFSHSVPGIIFSSGAIALLLKLFFLGSSFYTLFLWALIGNVSHIILDVLNSYGAQILWPVSRKKYSLNLLVLFDPVIVLVFVVGILWPGSSSYISWIILGVTSLYLLFRLYMRYSVFRFLKENYKNSQVKNITVMPAMISLWNWTFLIETDTKYIIGEVRWFTFKTGIKRVLDKVPINHFVKAALQSRIGRLFQSFTPYYHIHYYEDGDDHVVCFADLRYFVKNDFLHNATVVLSKEYEIAEAVFQPYSKDRRLSF